VREAKPEDSSSAQLSSESTPRAKKIEVRGKAGSEELGADGKAENGNIDPSGIGFSFHGARNLKQKSTRRWITSGALVFPVAHSYEKNFDFVIKSNIDGECFDWKNSWMSCC
jgi:hypothetical protein